jgi:thiamine-monophosphate kinase
MSMSETELIRRLTRDLPADSSVLTGPGDDCAVLDWGGSKLLFKTDAIVEGIHFERNTSPDAIGRKALARALSDMPPWPARRPTLWLRSGFMRT